MVKFAHIADSHLGGWRQPELSELNMQSFKKAIQISIDEKVDFVLFAGDLFDSAFPSIEILKDTFAEFKKLKDAAIRSFLIAGSHDYSVSGKTFLHVLEKAGFCEMCTYVETEDEVILNPCKYQTIFIYGYPGKKSGLEVAPIRKIKIKEPYENNFRILMLHTTIQEAAPDIPVDSVKLDELPKADYYALGHVHIDFEGEVNGKKVVYGGPTFPNNFKELQDLKWGSFYIVEINGFTKITKKELVIKEPMYIEVEINNALTATTQILQALAQHDLHDKILLLKVHGDIAIGKPSDINFRQIEEYVEKSGAYSFLKNTSKLEIEKKEFQVEFQKRDKEKIEELLIKKYEKENPSQFNDLIMPLVEALNIEKQEDERTATFESRLLAELSKIVKIELEDK